MGVASMELLPIPTKSSTHSERSRPAVPGQVVHRFRAMSTTRMGGHGQGRLAGRATYRLEISSPLLLTPYRRKVVRPDQVTVLGARDAWQCCAQPWITEASIDLTPIAPDRLDGIGADSSDPDKRPGTGRSGWPGPQSMWRPAFSIHSQKLLAVDLARCLAPIPLRWTTEILADP